MKTYCFCGRELTPFLTAQDMDQEADGTATPYGPEFRCDACKAESLKFRLTELQKRQQLQEKLLGMPRPRLGERYRKEWVEARQHAWGLPAKKRNRCRYADGKRTHHRFTQLCAEHYQQHVERMVQLFAERQAEELIQRPLGVFIPADTQNGPLVGSRHVRVSAGEFYEGEQHG